MDEAGTPSFPAHEPPPPEPQPSQAPQSSDLIDAWDEYRRNGDGHFSPRGLQELLDQWELAARVSHGDRIGAGGAMLLVETSPGTPHFWVLPSFNKSPRAVADWFDDASSGALTGRRNTWPGWPGAVGSIPGPGVAKWSNEVRSDSLRRATEAILSTGRSHRRATAGALGTWASGR